MYGYDLLFGVVFLFFLIDCYVGVDVVVFLDGGGC